MKPYNGFISIHAPREGSDTLSPHQNVSARRFQSTLPVRGATASERHYWRDVLISIHAPREGSDPLTKSSEVLNEHFNPRSP